MLELGKFSFVGGYVYFAKNLIIGEQVLDKENIISMLKEGVKVYDIFLICVCEQGNNVLEIIASTQIFKKMHAKYDYKVIAVCGSKKEAFSIVEDLVKSYYSGNYTHTLKERFIKMF